MDQLLSQSIPFLDAMGAEYSHIADSCLLVHICPRECPPMAEFDVERNSVRGMLCALVLRGSVTVQYNTEEYIVDRPSLIMAPHGTSIRMTTPDYSDVDGYILAIAPSFVQEINISFSAIAGESLISHESPVLELRAYEVDNILGYFRQIHRAMSDDFVSHLTAHIVSSLISAFFYQVMLYLHKRFDIVRPNHTGKPRNNYVQDFMKLVHMHFTRERSVNFYAAKLFISPKYLSLLVKAATGRSAARWIDYFVVSEAKNLLRFSGKNIQQVAYALNFPNQSSFGKYFKHLTGMSPTEFQKN